MNIGDGDVENSAAEKGDDVAEVGNGAAEKGDDAAEAGNGAAEMEDDAENVMIDGKKIDEEVTDEGEETMLKCIFCQTEWSAKSSISSKKYF